MAWVKRTYGMVGTSPWHEKLSRTVGRNIADWQEERLPLAGSRPFIR